jgi:electron transfer flavoprotein alpha subunit
MQSREAMIRRSLLSSRPRPHRLIQRTYASAAGPRALLFIEHSNGNIESGSLSALTAATQLGGEVTGIVVGDGIENVVEKAKK